MVRFVIVLATFSIAATPAISAAGDASKGEAIFRQCQLCHTATKNGGNGLGPNLFGVAGRKAASLTGFGYSPALKNARIVWTDDNLKKWVAGPSKLVPGTRMVFAGLSNPQDIANLIAFLHTRK